MICGLNGLKKMMTKKNPHSGSTLDDFLIEEGIFEEVTAQAHKQLLALQLQDIMDAEEMSKTSLAERLETSRSQLDRLLDPENTAVTLESLSRLATAVGRKLRIELV